MLSSVVKALALWLGLIVGIPFILICLSWVIFGGGRRKVLVWMKEFLRVVLRTVVQIFSTVGNMLTALTNFQIADALLTLRPVLFILLVLSALMYNQWEFAYLSSSLAAVVELSNENYQISLCWCCSSMEILIIKIRF